MNHHEITPEELGEHAQRLRDEYKARKEAEAITALEGAENDRKSALDGIFGAFKDAFAKPPRGQLGAWED